MKVWHILVVAVFGTTFVAVMPAAAKNQITRFTGNSHSLTRQTKPPYIEHEVLVKFWPLVINLKTVRGQQQLADFSARKGLVPSKPNKTSNLVVLRNTGKSTAALLAELRNDLNVESVQPNFQYTISSTDPDYTKLWGLNNTGQTVNGVAGTADADIDAPEAWAISEGAAITIAVIDTGLAYSHPDLANQLWNGLLCVDNDGNPLGNCNAGYDFEDDDTTPLPTSSTHGTHVAGTIAAEANNNVGLAGVAPNADIMALKSSLTTDEIISAIQFAELNGAKIINASWGGPSYDADMKAAIDAFSGLFIAAAGNSSDNHATLASYPCDYTSTNIICVAATTQSDQLASFSDYGAQSVDVGAPGVNIYSSTAETIAEYEDFESTVWGTVPAGWTTAGVGSSNWGVYPFTPPDTYSFGSSLYSDANVPYLNNTNTTITLPSMDLSSATGTTVDFYSSCDTEGDPGLLNDYMALEISPDGAEWPAEGVLGKWNEYSTTLNYDALAFDGTRTYIHFSEQIPSEYLTGTFTLRFRWKTNATVTAADACSLEGLTVTSFSDGSNELYGFLNGTSMATPHVAGLAGLLWGYQPSLTVAAVKNAVLNTGDLKASLVGKTKTGKRINAFGAINALENDYPSGSISINAGAGYTQTSAVTLNLSATDSVFSVKWMRLSSDGLTWTPWINRASSYSWNLTNATYGGTSTEGTKYVFVQYKNEIGKISSSYPDTIIYDDTVPTGTININSGAINAYSKNVTLTLNASDNRSGVGFMRFSNNGSTWTTWPAYQPSFSWNIINSLYGGNAYEGTKKVYVQYKDRAGNISSSKFDWLLYNPRKVAAITVYNFHPDAAGNELTNLNDEYVTLKNNLAGPITLNGWYIKDVAGSKYTFSSFTLPSKKLVTIHTGKGTNSSTQLYMGRTNPVWNNDHDTLYLYTSDNKLLMKKSY